MQTADTNIQTDNRRMLVRVMSYNVRFNNPADGEHAWPHRRDWVAEAIRSEAPDVLGLQEPQFRQITDLAERLPEYAWYGVGRLDGASGGEFAPVFFRRDRFELLDKACFWLSERPDEPGSLSWDAELPRVATWLKLKERLTGAVLFVFNTHFDHRGSEARRHSARLLLARIAQLADGRPVVLTGDFNCTAGSPPYQILTGEEAAKLGQAVPLTDARGLSVNGHQGPDSSWTGFLQIVPDFQIDFIFVGGPVRVLLHEIRDNQRGGRYPSDHLPVLADLEISGEASE